MGENLIVPGMHVRVTALPGACLRTKNRIRERGAHGFTLKARRNCMALDNRMSVMLMGNEPGKIAGDQWLGWLPENEIEIAQFVG